MPTKEKAQALACVEVWGGNQAVTRPMELPGLAVWLYSQPLAGSVGGDVYYFSLCSQGNLTRVGMADVSGHGKAVSRLGARLRELMQEHINTFDQSQMARELNRDFGQQAGKGFATVALLGICRGSGELVLTNGGHPWPLWYRARAKMWTMLMEGIPETQAASTDLPLGVIPGTGYRQMATRLDPGDLVIVYSDAFSDSCDQAGQMLGPQGVLQLARDFPVDSPEAAGRALLKSVEHYRGGRPTHDDQTVVVLQRLPA